MSEDSRLRIGQLARRAGVSIRALHHYDAIGLLVPGDRSPARHRLYSLVDLERVRQIRALAQLGLPLGEIRNCLEGSVRQLRVSLERSVARLEERIACDRELALRLSELVPRLGPADRLAVDDLAGVLADLVLAMRHFTRPQLRTLVASWHRMDKPRSGSPSSARHLFMSRLQAAIDRSARPGSREVRHLARTWTAIATKLARGDARIVRGLLAMYREHPSGSSAWVYLVEPNPDPAMAIKAARAAAALGPQWSYLREVVLPSAVGPRCPVTARAGRSKMRWDRST